MGDGTSFGAVTSTQPGIIVRDDENWPKIPEKLLSKTPEELQRGINKSHRVIGKENDRVIPNHNRIEDLTFRAAILEFALAAVERKRQSKERI